MNNFEKEEIPKYKKKKPSSTSKSLDKTRHKHSYDGKCITKYPPFIPGGNPYMCITTYCTVCGKIYNSEHPYVEEDITRKNGLTTKRRRLMKNEEILEKYKDLEVIELNEYGQKYVSISKECADD